jgi:hypothetical protein
MIMLVMVMVMVMVFMEVMMMSLLLHTTTRLLDVLARMIKQAEPVLA